MGFSLAAAESALAAAGGDEGTAATPPRRRASTALENLYTGVFRRRSSAGGGADGPTVAPAANDDGGDLELQGLPRATDAEQDLRVSMSEVYPERNDAVAAQPRSSVAPMNPLHADASAPTETRAGSRSLASVGRAVVATNGLMGGRSPEQLQT